MLQNYDILFPETKDKVTKPWLDFNDLYQTINDQSENASTVASLVQEKAKQLINLFCSLGGVRQGYKKARVAPYMHFMPNHIPKFISDHGSLKVFTGQGVEKNNDDAKRVYFNKSNKCNATRDVLQLEARQFVLKHCDKEKRTYRKRNSDYWDLKISKNLDKKNKK